MKVSRVWGNARQEKDRKVFVESLNSWGNKNNIANIFSKIPENRKGWEEGEGCHDHLRLLQTRRLKLMKISIVGGPLLLMK